MGQKHPKHPKQTSGSNLQPEEHNNSNATDNTPPQTTPQQPQTAQLSAEEKSQRVIKKLMNNDIYRHKLEHNKDLLESFAGVLSDEQELERTYLQKDFLKTIELIKEYKDKTDNEILDARRPSMFQSATSDSTMMTIQEKAKKRQSEDEDVDELSDEELQESAHDPEITLAENTVKVKLVISEIANSAAKRAVRRLISPVMSKLDISPEMGMFHSALIIGPWYIEWNTSAICVPRKCIAGSAFLTADIDHFANIKDIDAMTQKLSEIIVDWNLNKGYVNRGGDKTKVGNCQDFVEDVLRRLGLKTEFTGPLGEFVKRLKEKGVCDTTLYMDESFREKFGITEKKITFKTHKEVDEFASKLMDVDCEANYHHKAEWNMLKSFDRAFWLRHYKFPDDAKWKCIRKKDDDDDDYEEDACPFGDPVSTYSIRVQQ